MAYGTRQGMIDRFGESEMIDLTDHDGLGIIDDTPLTRAIADAGAIIDARLRVRYPLPLLSVPPEIEGAACDITRYLLWDVRAPDLVKERYQQAMTLLRDIASGRADLPDGSIDPDQDPQTGGIAAPLRTLYMGDDVLADML